MTFDRREFLRRTGLAASVISLATTGVRCTDDDEQPKPEPLKPDTFPRYEYDGELGPETLFEHGVASGDPTESQVILWTHASIDGDEDIDVWYEIGIDQDFEYRVDVGTFKTSASRGHTVKLDIKNLDPGKTYYYRFMALGRTSPMGRTRTTPTGNVDRLRFGVVSCASYTSAYFHAYDYASKHHDLDAIIHLGDYIYEYGARGFGGSEDMMDGRILDPPYEILTLDDYRRRYACYRKDDGLSELHRQFPFIIIWDDHETANNSYKDGAQNHDEGDEGKWTERKAAALQAYFEWLPIRDNDEDRIWRTVSYGNLVDLIMLDTRLWGRSKQENIRGDHFDPDRTLLGDDQQVWLDDQLKNSKTKWRIIGQQVMMGQLKTSPAIKEQMGNVLNNDQWDGYEVSRDKFFKTITDNDIDNIVVLTGDIHTSWAMDLSPDPTNADVYKPDTGEGSLGVEFVVPGVSSAGLTNAPIVQRVISRSNPHIKWYELEKRGYVIIDVTPERVQSAWWLMDDAEQPQTTEMFGAAYSVASGAANVVQDDMPVPSRTSFPPPAP